MAAGATLTSRRALLGGMAAIGAGAILGFGHARGASSRSPLTKPIPATDEAIPVIGMGSWITFNVGNDPALRTERAEVLQAFFDLGGGMIDSSPMYGSSESVIGSGLDRISDKESLFAASKVWTLLQSFGPGQMEESRALWGIERFDLMQVHNLLNWDGHLETLRANKSEGRIRYIGITTSHGRRHDEFEEVMLEPDLDFVQFTYNILDREAEERLLPLASDRGLAVIANRPFRRKALIERFERHPLPAWAVDIDCENWPQFLLKFIVSHPAVTCAIPATSRVDHMRENMGALEGRMPDASMRTEMIRYVEGL
jgi:diketogulonate reductase-like aldo/keto reductase